MEKKKPSLLKRIATPIAIMVGGELIKEPVKKIFSEIAANAITKTLIVDMLGQNVQPFLTKYFKNIPKSYATEIDIKDDKFRVKEIPMGTMYDHTTKGYYTDYAFIEGIPCKLTLESKYTGHDTGVSNTYLTTLNINHYPDRLAEIIKREVDAEINNPKNRVHRIRRVESANVSRDVLGAFPRTFDNVFVPKEIKDKLCGSLDNFMNKADWYIQNSIPYHFGILLYGAPGTGKTSIAQAIANYTHSDMFVVPGDYILQLPNMIRGHAIPTAFLRKHDFNIILVEDIDCGMESWALASRDLDRIIREEGDCSESDIADCDKYQGAENYQKRGKNSGLASVLNSIDGIDAPRNTIFVFTTNHIEKLDPALIRPGRIDLMLEIKHVCPETFREFMTHHYGEDVVIPKGLKIKDGITFAGLQVMVMGGATPKDIINFVRK